MATIKTAISIDPLLMKEVDAWAQELKVSRSHLFSIGVEKLIQQYSSKRMLEAINKVYADSDTEEAHLDAMDIEAMYNEFSKLMADEEW